MLRVRRQETNAGLPVAARHSERRRRFGVGDKVAGTGRIRWLFAIFIRTEMEVAVLCDGWIWDCPEGPWLACGVFHRCIFGTRLARSPGHADRLDSGSFRRGVRSRERSLRGCTGSRDNDFQSTHEQGSRIPARQLGLSTSAKPIDSIHAGTYLSACSQHQT